MSAALAETLALLASASEGEDLRPIARRLGRELMRATPQQDVAVIALGALMALRDDAMFERVISEEVERRGLELVRLGIEGCTRLEAAVAAHNLLEALPQAHRLAVLRQFDDDRAAAAPQDAAQDARARMASLYLSLPLAHRQAFLAWAEEEVAA